MGDEPAVNNLTAAVDRLKAGRPEETLAICRALVTAQPQDVEAWHLMGVAHAALRQPPQALVALREAARLKPDHLEIQRNLGAILAQGERFEEAVPYLEDAHRADPDHAGTLMNLVRALRQSGDSAAAIARLESYLARHGQDAQGWYELALLREAQRQSGRAIEALEQLLRLDPAHNAGERMLATLYFNRRDFTEAADCWRHVAARMPDDAMAQRQLADVLAIQDEDEAADAAYARALELRPDWGTEFRRATLMPSIMESSAAIVRLRARYGERIAALAQRNPRLADPEREVSTCVAFNLAYHGHDDLALQRQLTALYLSACPALGARAKHLDAWKPGSRLRLGVVSTNLTAHTVGFVTLGLLQCLDRERFELVLLRPPAPDNAFHTAFGVLADKDVRIPSDLAGARTAIAEQACDILYYPDIGMSPFTYFLLFSRLAPVQCVGWGHPDTTGIPNADYWMSSSVWEPPGAQAQYSETLVRLAAPPIHYRPMIPNPPSRSRQDLRLPETGRLYLCAMSLFKLHPAFDPMLRAVLRRDPTAWLLLAEGHSTAWQEPLRRRIAGGDEALLQRMIFLPRYPLEEFTALASVVDCLLDPIYFGGGRTSLDLFHTGAPIVTWPGPFMRSRITSGLYRRMGVDELVARDTKDYVERALRVAQDEDYRHAVKARIREASGALYETVEAVREVEDFFAAAVAAAASGSGPVNWDRSPPP
ncbi:tetratricopeptide repeat protein [Hypericibacter sp.]|uniref:O-linked N-acetylglucosamine transferase, SPINDLY family protein n=1 Tax=Hypericibacter sp. TaxID=2705401 RepID=UPI003D6CCFDA